MSYVGRGLQSGAFRQLDDISSGFDGSDTTHTMQVNSVDVTVGDVNQILLSLGGVIQNPGTDFTVSGSTLTFTTAPATGTNFFAVLLGSDNGGTVTPTDLSVTTDKIAADQITKAKLADTIDVFAGTALSAADLGVGIHIKTADSSASVDSTSDELVIEGSGSSGMTILSGTSSEGGIKFGDSGDNDAGRIVYDHSSDSMLFLTSGNTQMTIDGNGHVTKPNQSAFSVNDAGTTTNLSTGAAISFGTEVFDLNADFASNTFTAPVTGKYQISYQLRFQEFDADFTYFFVQLTTSNRSYSNILSGGQHDSDAAYISFHQSILCDMDANDTCDIAIAFSGGAAQCDVATREFTGVLVC